MGIREISGSPFELFPLVSPISPPITIVCPDWTLTIVCTERVLIGGASPGLATGPGVADLGLHVERDEPALIDVRRHLQQHAGVDVLRRRRHHVGRAADDALLVDRDLVAGLDRRLLVVERRQVRIRDDLRVAVRVEQVQRRLDAAGEVRVVDDVGEALRERQDGARRPGRRRRQRRARIERRTCA